MSGRIERLAAHTILLAAACMITFAVGYRTGVARQERRLLDEFLINAARLGIIDVERLSELVEVGGTNTMDDAASDDTQPP